MQMIGMENITENNKSKKLLLLAIIATLVLIIIIVVLLLFVKNVGPAVGLSLTIDDKKVEISENLIILEGDTNKVYFNIKSFASYLGYEAHNGEFKEYSEDTTKCYIENEFETASFIVENNIIYKCLVKEKEEYSEYKIEDAVKYINGELYVSTEGMAIATNSAIVYKPETQQVIIKTLSNLYESYSATIIEKGYKEIDSKFDNQKAILKGMLVVKNAKGKLGVLDLNYNELISCRYNEINYEEKDNHFVIKNEQGKIGIISNKGITKVEVLYDEITNISRKNDLYLVKLDNKYGIIDALGKVRLYPEYTNLGIVGANFPKDKIVNDFITYNKYVVVEKDSKWGIIDIDGNKITECIYDKMGCVQKPTVRKTETFGVALIEEYEAFIVCKNGKYGIINARGEELIPCGLSSVYAISNSGNKQIYMEYQGQELNVIEYLISLQ